MRRRKFITLVGGAAAWPLAARAQQQLPVVGFALGGSIGVLRKALAAFEDGLKESGYIPGRNVTVEYRFAEGQLDQISEFVRSNVAVLVATSTGALSAKKATSTIPIVFSVGVDPVKAGLVPNLNRPGGNVTGVYCARSEAARVIA